MDIKRFDKSLQILNDKHQKYLQLGDKRDINVLKNMLDIALEINDAELIGYIYHSLAFAEHFIVGRYKQFLKYLRLAFNYLIKVDSQEELMNVYYLIAMNALNKGFYDIAYNYTFEAKNIAEHQGKITSAAILDLTIAHIMLQLGQYDKALKILRKSIINIKKDKTHPHYYSNLASAYLNESIAYINLEKDEDARKTFSKAESFIMSNIEEFRQGTLLDYEVLKLILLVKNKKDKDAQDSFYKTKKLIMNAGQIHLLLDQINLLCSTLLKYNKEKWVGELIDDIDKRSLPSDAIDSIRIFTNIKINYYTKINNQELLFECYEKLNSIHEIILEEQKAATAYAQGLADLSNSISTQRREAFKENEKLTNMAREDELTGLANRYAASIYLDEIFENAYKNKTKLGIAYIDVDNLRIINDTQGHLAGDEYLRRISKIFKEYAEEKNYYPARYGGDEFVLFFENFNTKDINKCINFIKEKIDIDFSAGIYNAIPKIKDKTWNFLAKADNNLYKEKEIKKKSNIQKGIK